MVEFTRVDARILNSKHNCETNITAKLSDQSVLFLKGIDEYSCTFSLKVMNIRHKELKSSV